MITAEILAKMELFSGIPDQVLNCIAELCKEESFPAQTILFATGRPADCIYLLLDGTVSLKVFPTSLPEPLTIARLRGPGQAFGWSAVVGTGYYTASAEATNDVRVVSLSGKALVECLADNPCEGFEIMRRIADIVSQRLTTVRTLLLETVCD